MKRAEILALCYSVHSAADTTKAKQARYAYLALDPKDQEVFDMGEML